MLPGCTDVTKPNVFTAWCNEGSVSTTSNYIGTYHFESNKNGVMLKNFFIKNSVVPECKILGKAQPNLDFHSVTL